MVINTKILSEILAKLREQHIERIIYHNHIFMAGMKIQFNIYKSVNVIKHMRRCIKVMNYMTTSVSTGEAFDKA